MTLTKKPGTELAAYHCDRSDKARQTLIAVLSQIETEITERGYYSDPKDPDSQLRLLMAQVPRRAGLGDAFLRNERHYDLREIMKDWLHAQKMKFATSKPAGKKVKRDTIQFYEDALKKTSSEAQAWLIKQAGLEKEISELKQNCERIQGSYNVVGINSRWQE